MTDVIGCNCAPGSFGVAQGGRPVHDPECPMHGLPCPWTPTVRRIGINWPLVALFVFVTAALCSPLVLAVLRATPPVKP